MDQPAIHSAWKTYADGYEYEHTYTNVVTAAEYNLGCIRIKWNANDFKAAIQAQEGIDQEPTVNLRDVIPLNPEYDDDDEIWARKYWKGPIVLMHGMGDNVDDWINHAFGPH